MSLLIKNPFRRLVVVLILTMIVFAVQFIGGVATNSLSLLANAGHFLGDIGSATLALVAARLEKQRPTQAHSYGYGRSGTVAAFINALMLGAIGVSMIVTGLLRLFHPVAVTTGPILIIGLIGLAFNLLSTLILHQGDHSDLNLRAMFAHAASDAAASLAIVVAAWLIERTGWTGWDPLTAALIGLAIGHMAWRVARPSLRVLMEATPEGLDPETIRQTILTDPAVDEVHHLHVWSLGPRYHALSAHVRLRDMSIREGQSVIDTVETILAEQYHIHHVTIQIETDQHPQSDPYCHI
ncbi:MAG: cation diffusion facilitator family transporter [Thermaerobacter sp.]|nr:cation diffusion facilitator family transporter [Thermaerobacter sp.]